MSSPNLAEVKMRIARGEDLYFDETLIYRAGLSDLDSGAIEDLVTSALDSGIDVGEMPRDRLLTNWHLLGGTEQGGRPTECSKMLSGSCGFISRIRICPLPWNLRQKQRFPSWF